MGKMSHGKFPRDWYRKPPQPAPPKLSDFSTWGGFCRIHTTDPAISAITDLHGICRFCLLALNHHDAVSRITRSGIVDFSFLTQSLSAVEVNLTNYHHGIINGPSAAISIYLSSVHNACLLPDSYILFNPLTQFTPVLISNKTIAAITTNTKNTLHARGFLDKLFSFGGLLSKPGDKNNG